MNRHSLRWTGRFAAGALAFLFGTIPAARAVTNINWTGATDNSWNTGTNWQGNAVPVPADTANFTTGSGTIDLGVDQTIFGITFDTGAGAFTLGNAGPNAGPALLMQESAPGNAAQNSATIQFGSPSTAGLVETIDAPIVVMGSGNAFGDLVISLGRVTTATNVFDIEGAITSGAASGTSLVSFSGSGTGISEVSGSLSDGASGGRLAVSMGGGIWVLSGDNSGMTGGFTLAKATTDINSSTALGSGALTVSNGAIFDNTSGAAITVAGLTGTTIAGAFTFGGTNDLNLGSSAINVSSRSSMTLNGTHALTLGGNIAAASGVTLTVAGTGSLVLSGDNSADAGGIVVGTSSTATGNLVINNAKALGTGAFTINGGTIDNTSGHAIALDAAAQPAESWNSFTFLGTNDLDLGASAIALKSATVVTTRAGTLTAGGVISGAFALTKAGAGTLVLGGVNTYTGTTTVNAGTLIVSAGGSVAGAITVNAGNLVFNGSTTQGVTIKPNTAATSVLSGTGSFAAVTMGGGTAGSAAVLAAGGSNAIGAMQFTGLTLNDGAQLQFDLNSDGTPSIDTLTIAGRLTFATTGTLGLVGTDLGDTTLGLGTVLTLMTYAQKSGNGFTNYADGSSITIGNNVFRINYGATAMTLTDIAAVPEPSAWALLGLGALGLAAARRRAAA